MSMRQKLLIIEKGQFGTLTDSYKWCQYLCDRYNIDYICFDSGKKKISFKNVNVKYVSSKGLKIIRGLRYLITVLLFLFNYKGKIIVVYFSGCEIFKYFYKNKKMILDIRTLSVSINPETNERYDNKLKSVCDKFDFVTIISDGLRKKLDLKEDKSSILPLGSDVISESNKQFDKLKLLYVGTFNNRQLELTIRGFAQYVTNSNDTTAEYHIVGNGNGNILEQLKKIAFQECKLEEQIFFYGYVPHCDLKQFFDRCNIGVSFIPITEYYQFQPPTKTYEYVLSGLYTIATSTQANKKIINKENGVLISDNIDSFSCALKGIGSKKDELSSSEIRETLKNHTWEFIVNNYLIPVLEK